jgi:hypothetical protein
MEQFFSGMSITTGAVRYKDLAYLLVTKDDIGKEKVPHTRIYEIDRGRVGGIDLDWMGVSGCVCQVPEERFVAIGEAGFVYVFGGGQTIEEQPVCKDEEVFLREVRCISNGRAFSVGPNRRVFRRTAPNLWEDISAPPPTAGDFMDAGFESIDGKDESDIFAVGWGGEIWHFNGNDWINIDSPTNLALYKIRYDGQKFFYSCGQAGTLLQGNEKGWEIIENNLTDEDFWGMEWFNNKLFVASLNILYVLENEVLSPVDFGDTPPPSTCYHLSAADGIMWSIGPKDVMEYDGIQWTRIL